MRGADITQENLFTTVHLDTFVPFDHPLRAIRDLFNQAMKRINGLPDSAYSEFGRESTPPERLLRAQLLQVLYTLHSEEHFSVDGTLIQAWASQQSFCSKDEDDSPPEEKGRNAARDFHGGKCLNDTHESRTDPEARNYKKANGCAERDTAAQQLNELPVKVRVDRVNAVFNLTFIGWNLTRMCHLQEQSV